MIYGKPLSTIVASCAIIFVGCRSPYYADQGAAIGGLTGAGVGAAIADATDRNAAAGALFGSAVGAISGSAIGQGLDEVNAQNRALIEEKLGRKMVGSATIDDTIAMSQAGLSDGVIVNYVRDNGLTRQLSASDMIHMKQSGVSDAVIQALQEMPGSSRASAAPRPSPPVVVQEHYYSPIRPWPRIHSHYWHGPRRHHHRGWNWGFSFSN